MFASNRNVEIFGSDHSQVMAGFWKSPKNYISYADFFQWLVQVLEESTDPSTLHLFNWDLEKQCRSHLQPWNSSEVQLGDYVLCAEVLQMEPLCPTLQSCQAHWALSNDKSLRIHTKTAWFDQTCHYRDRARERNGRCTLSGKKPVTQRDGKKTWSSIKATHIYPRSDIAGWQQMSFIKHVKDPAPLAEVGGSSRIDSLNNVFMLRAEPHEEFDAYNMSFHPGRGFEVIAWQSSADDFAGMHVNFDHIVNPDLMPAPVLFEHQMWLALMRKFRGAGEEYFDEDDALDDGQGLSTRPEIWTQGQGKARFEMLFAHRLQGHAAAQEAAAAAALA